MPADKGRKTKEKSVFERLNYPKKEHTAPPPPPPPDNSEKKTMLEEDLEKVFKRVQAIPKDCTREKDEKEEKEKKQPPKVSEKELDTIIERLRADTKSSSQQQPGEHYVTDIISKGPVSKYTAEAITNRLNQQHTISSGAQEGDQSEPYDDVISKEPMPMNKVLDIIERLFTTHTESSEGLTKPPKITTNEVSRPSATDEELQEIYNRLHGTHTKTSKGGEECRPWDPVKVPGQGLPMFPFIEDLDKRFNGSKLIDAKVGEEKIKEIIEALRKNQTVASQARLDPYTILLYPERTLLMNNPERIRQFQENGAIVKQVILQAREKWYF